MEFRQRDYPMFSACGLNCGLCPRYQMDGASKCPGCAGKGFLAKHPKCGVLSCSQRMGIEYCYQCNEFPCIKYNGADQSDSFITHKNQFIDLEKAKVNGIDFYKNELNEKIRILENLLENYDDGRHKSFFCLAINLLELKDIKYIVEKITSEIHPDMSQKEKAVYVSSYFKTMAENSNIELKLRKKSKL